MKDAHHIYQDAAVRDLPGYKRGDGPSVQLDGPANRIGTPHYHATQVQRQAGGGTLGAEHNMAIKALQAAGFSSKQARAAANYAKAFFKKLGFDSNTKTRIPGNRKNPPAQ